jgi:hypothetical protein
MVVALETAERDFDIVNCFRFMISTFWGGLEVCILEGFFPLEGVGRSREVGMAKA